MGKISNLTFSTADESALGPGVPAGLNYSLPSSLVFDPTPLSKTLSWPLNVTASLSISAGLTGQVSLTAGKFDASYPISVDAQFPTSVIDGSSFAIDTSDFSVSNASVDLTGPGVGASIDLFLKGSASLSAFGATIQTGFNLDTSLSLAHSFKSSYGSVTIAAPTSFSDSSQATSAHDALPALNVSGVDDTPFLSGSIDLAKAAALIAGGPAAAQILSGSIPVWGDYTLLSADLNAGLDAAQDLTFAPEEVDVTLTASDGEVHSGQLGQVFTFKAPSSGTGTLQITATYTLIYDVITQTGIVGTLGFSFEALDLPHVGPLISATIPSSGWQTGLGPLNSITSNFRASLTATDTYNISYSASAPPPPPPSGGSAGSVAVTTNKGAVVAVSQSTQIASSALLATDSAYADSQLTYVIVTPPSYGTLLKSGSPLQGSFTQADIDAGLIQYRENGIASPSDRFTFEAFDPAGHNSGIQTFTIQITPAPPAPPSPGPAIVTNQGLAVTIGSTGTISQTALRASDPVYGDASLTYRVLSGPSYGTLTNNGSSTSTFTQADIDNGRIQYHENGASTPSDSFTFEVLDPAGNQTAIQSFSVNVLQPPPPASTRVRAYSYGPAFARYRYLANRRNYV